MVENPNHVRKLGAEMNESGYFSYWGKAKPASEETAQYHLLPYHCLDVAAVAYAYLVRNPAFRQQLMAVIETDDDEQLKHWLSFWVALHDLGKYSEAFQGQRPDLFASLRGRAPNAAKSYRLRHDSLGMLYWREVLSQVAADQCWFGANTGSILDGLDCWARAVTGHHGQPPEASSDYWTLHFDKRDDRDAIAGFVCELQNLFFSNGEVCIAENTDSTEFCRASRDVSWWVAGLTVLADWLGSNADYFPYCAKVMPLADYWLRAKEQAEKALDESGVLPVKRQEELSFNEVFPAIELPSPLQAWAAAVPLDDSAQLYMLEDVTGAGKTEAAVILAHRLMSAGCADGFFIGLPTMATANAMYGRIAQMYASLFAGNASLVLAHGQRNLVEAFAASVVPDGPPDTDSAQSDDTATARCAAWLADHNKRALLAPAGVGTIDQALLAVLHSKHQSLRLLGLFRKVLVVDEVHACDAYMQGVLEILLEFHARAGGSAILLSATLPGRMKQALLDAFARGRNEDAPALQTDSLTAFPLVTAWSAHVPEKSLEASIATRPDVLRQLAVRYVSDQSQVIAGIDAALSAGKCVCWMRNTVADALDAHALFKGRLPDEKLTLFHARFTLYDRLTTEAKVLECFGKNSTPEQRTGRLVIATQVAEQSLDADWDMVVSDLAPIDRLIQRAGRLQRHPRDADGRRLSAVDELDQRGQPCLWVFGPAWTDEPAANWFKAAFPKAAGVYPHHGQLWLTARTLQAGSFAMPDDARRLIEGVFGDEAEVPAGLQTNANQAEGNGFAAASEARQNTVKLTTGYERGGIDWWSEAKTPSRLGEASMNVLLARWEGGQLRPWVSGKHGWAYSSVRVAERLIARTAVPEDAKRKAVFDAVTESLSNKGQWSVLLALEETGDGWVGEAWSGESDSRPSTLNRWCYNVATGLQAVKTSNNEGDSE
ncbi:MAG: CRISPR-associated helicase Cas3' [Propionivibrio sp.]|nr:CRISPR-associated helicase Cas3' [Propionivibrio sp.]